MLVVKHTKELTQVELVKILKQRVAVFVVEQKCPYQEVDDDDLDDLHIYLEENNEIQAYIRLMDRGDFVNFGRVLVVKKFRGKGLGRQIVQDTLDIIAKKYPHKPIKIQAQHYLEDFYKSFGFKPKSKVYLEDGIPHLDMELDPE